MRVHLLALALLLSPFAACDDPGSTAPAAPFEATAPDDKTVGELSATEQEAFCNELAAHFKSQVSDASVKKLGCYLVALAFSGGNRQACEQAAQGCISDPEMSAGTADVSCDTSRVGNCTATVAELEACYSDMTSVAKSLAGRISCSTPQSDLAALSEKPASCKTVEAKCPTLFEDDTPPE